MLAFLLCGYYGAHLFIEVQARYRYFLMPVLFLLAGAGAQLVLAWWQGRKNSGAKTRKPLDLNRALSYIIVASKTIYKGRTFQWQKNIWAKALRTWALA